MKKALIVILFLFFGTKACQATPIDFYCFFNKNLSFHCQREAIAGGQKIQLIDKNNSHFFVSPNNLNLRAIDYPFLILRARSKIDYPYIRLNVMQKGIGVFPADDLESLFDSIISGQDFRTYYFRLTDSVVWKGWVQKIYLQTEGDNLEIQSIDIAHKNSGFYIRSFWQELTRPRLEAGYFINLFIFINFVNIWPGPTLNGIPLIRYENLVLICILSTLFVWRFFDRTIKKKWPLIFLATILFFWLSMAILSTINQSKVLIKDTRELSGRPDLQRQFVILDRLQIKPGSAQAPRQFLFDFESFLDFVKGKIPLRSKVYFQSDLPMFVFMARYHLIDDFVVVKKAEKADFILIYAASRSGLNDLDLSHYRPYLDYPSQKNNLDSYKLILIRK